MFDGLVTVRNNMKHLFKSFIEFLRRSKKTLLLILAVAAITIVLTTTISMLLSGINHLHVPSFGTIHTLGVEAYGGDIKLKEDGTAYIDWGTIYPGTLKNCSLYIRSKSNIEAILKLETANWTFRDSGGKNVTSSTNSYMNLTWNYTGTLVSPGEEIYVTLTLRASPDMSFIEYILDKNVKEFSFDIYLYASEK